MLTHRAVGCWIEVDGSPLGEYDMKKTENKTTCYVQSLEGKTFSVHFKHLDIPPFFSLRGNIFLDGMPAGAGLLLPTDNYIKLTGHEKTAGVERPFQFRRLKLTDDDSQACQDHHRLQNLGTIKVAMEWVQEIPTEEFIPPPSVPDLSLEPVHEKVKKASVHCVGLGDAVPARRKHWYRTSRVAYMPTFEFVFSYAPSAWLQAKGILTQPEPPSSLSSSSKHASSSPQVRLNSDFAKSDRSSNADSSLSQRRKRTFAESRSQSTAETITVEDSDTERSDDEIELLDPEEVEMYKALKAKLASRKGKGNPRKRVKLEPLAVPPGTFTSGEVIDLTGDSDDDS